MSSGASRAGAAATALAALLVAAAVLAAFLPALGYGFAPIDDEKNFLDNPSFRGLGLPQLAWMFTAHHSGHYIPVTWLTLGLDYTLWGQRPFGYHLTSLLFHLANAVAFLLLCVRLLRREARAGDALAGALAAALLFAVHPLRVESVAWISERRDLVCGLFCLLALHAYVTAAEASGQRRRWAMALTCGLFAAALLSKGIAVALPVAFLALDVTLLRRLPPQLSRWSAPELRAVILEKAAVLAVALLSAATTLAAIGYVLEPVRSMGLGARLATAVYGLTFYAQKTVLPYPLPLLVYHAPFLRLSASEVAVRAGLLVAAAAAALAAWRRGAPGLLAAAATYAAFVLPVSGLLQAGPQLVAHRYSYHSCWPWALLLGFAVCRWLGSGPEEARRRMAAAAGGLLLASGLVVLTRRQLALWRDPLTFSTAAAEASPAAWQPRYTLAGIHLRAGRWEEAARQLRVGLVHDPAAAPLLNMAALLFATCPDDRVRSGHESRALAERLVGLTRGRDPWALFTFSAALAEDGDFGRAVVAARQALAAAGPQPGPEPAGRLRAALALYEAGRPLRMEPADWGQDRLGP
jgi:hypothetical protein